MEDDEGRVMISLLWKTSDDLFFRNASDDLSFLGRRGTKTNDDLSSLIGE